MGNWRTVFIEGTCDQKETSNLTKEITPNDDYSNFDALSTNTGGLMGLGNWATEKIHRIGNLAERDYSVEAVANHLKELVKTAPSLNIKIHCGGDYESTECLKTIIVKNKIVKICEPGIKEIPDIPQDQMEANFFKAIMR